MSIRKNISRDGGRKIDSLRNTKLKHFEDIDLEALFSWVFDVILIPQSFPNILKNVLRVIENSFFNRGIYIYTCNGSRFLFSMPETLERVNIINMIRKVASTAPDYDMLYWKKYKFPRPMFSFSLLYNLVLWNRSLKNAEIDINDRLVLMVCLIRLYKFKNNINKIKISQYSLLTVFYDSVYIENYLVQMFKQQNIKTASLQHGIYNAPRGVNNYEYKGVELRYSISDYLLAWNQFTKKEAVYTGMMSEKIKILGIPYYIDERAVCTTPSNRIFGVVLNTKNSEEDNEKLVEYANQLAEGIGYKYILRYHPNYVGNEYTSLVNANHYIGNNKTSLLQYANSVEFSLLSVSTAYIDLTYMGHKVYRFANGSEKDKYKDINYMSFTNIEELHKLLHTGDDNLKQKEIFDFLCETKDVRGLYSAFFDSLLRGRNTSAI